MAFDIVSVLASGVLSSSLATAITLIVQRKRASRERRLDCLRRVAAHRAPPPTAEWIEALNEIFVTFNESDRVMKAVATASRETQSPSGLQNGTLLDLVKSMMDDLNLSKEHIDDAFIMRPFQAASKR
jgi:hypothetical protein